jgi:ribosomal protein S18 acetylase RimI-like enzyme
MEVNPFNWFRPPPKVFTIEQCTTDEFSTFLKSRVKIWNPDNFEQRRNRLHEVFIARDAATNQIVGCAAIKEPFSLYKKKIFKRARVGKKRHRYALEFGYVAIDKNYQRMGLGRAICRKTLETEVAMFSTLRNDNVAMYKILISLGFTKCGFDFTSELEPNQMLSLYVKEAASG